MPFSCAFIPPSIINNSSNAKYRERLTPSTDDALQARAAASELNYAARPQAARPLPPRGSLGPPWPLLSCAPSVLAPLPPLRAALPCTTDGPKKDKWLSERHRDALVFRPHQPLPSEVAQPHLDRLRPVRQMRQGVRCNRCDRGDRASDVACAGGAHAPRGKTAARTGWKWKLCGKNELMNGTKTTRPGP